jgi:VanZ family protein
MPATPQARPLWSLLWRWGPPLLWMVVIATFSADAFSAEETSRFLFPLLRWLFPDASPATLDLVHAGIRKVMHVLEFGILALLWYRALSWNGSGWQTRAALAAFLLAVGAAGLDEVHQAFVPSRTGTVMDVGWDGVGAGLGLVGRRAILKR